MKYTDRVKLGPNQISDRQVTADEFMDDYTPTQRNTYKGRLHCRLCNSEMVFIARIIGKSRAYFRHSPGRIGKECENTRYVPYDNNRPPAEIKEIIRTNNTFGIRGHKYDIQPTKKTKSTQQTTTAKPKSEHLQNKPVTQKNTKRDKTDLSIEEILKQVSSGEDLDKKHFLFYGKCLPFKKIFVNVHSINSQMRRRLSDGEKRIYWGDFYKICCKKNGKDCELCKLQLYEILDHEIYVFCGKRSKEEPIIQFNEKCSTELIKKYNSLCTYHYQSGYLAVVTESFISGRNPTILVDDFLGKVCYIEHPNQN